jgi:hypothetical protein
MATVANIERCTDKTKLCETSTDKPADFIITDTDGKEHYLCVDDALSYFKKRPVPSRTAL